jgi:hypothetical protein
MQGWKQHDRAGGVFSRIFAVGLLIDSAQRFVPFADLYPNNLKMLFLREIKVLEARQCLEALVIPKRPALTRLQGLLAPLLHVAEMAFPQQLKTSIFKLFGYKTPDTGHGFGQTQCITLAFNRRAGLVVKQAGVQQEHPCKVPSHSGITSKSQERLPLCIGYEAFK